MSKKTKIWLIIAVSLVLVSTVIFGGTMMALGWDYTKLSTGRYETNTYEISGEYEDISIKTETADVLFALSEDGKCKVVCYEQKNLKHAVIVQDSTLLVEVIDTRKWYEHFGINFGVPQITVYLPEGEYGALTVYSVTGDVEIPKGFGFKSIDISESTGNVNNFASVSNSIRIKTRTGNISTQNISAGTIELSVTTGKVTAEDVKCLGDVTVNVSTGKADLKNIQCKNLLSDGNTGDLCMQNVIATEKFSIERSTGKVKFDGCDAAQILVKTDTGDVTGSLLTDKVFVAQTDTGNIDVPKTTTGGKCEVTTDTGNIKIKIK